MHVQTTMDVTETTRSDSKVWGKTNARVWEKIKHAHACVSAASDWTEIYWAENKAVNKEVAPADISRMNRSWVVATLQRWHRRNLFHLASLPPPRTSCVRFVSKEPFDGLLPDLKLVSVIHKDQDFYSVCKLSALFEVCVRTDDDASSCKLNLPMSANRRFA